MTSPPKAALGHAESNRASDDDATATVVHTDEPSYMMYMPQEGTFGDSTTLYDGAPGSSSQTIQQRPRLPSMSSTAFRASLKQMNFNNNRVALDRAINNTIEILSNLTEENKSRPVFFPAESSDTENLLLNSPRAHLALVRSNADLETKTLAKAPADIASDESISVEPADFKVLKLNLKMGHNANVLTHMDKKSISSLLEQKLAQQIKYLLNLKDRVDDTSSKVFVTGDLNAGKSTFCNALLRRKVLPEDQQPCTSIFCEVIDAKTENKGIEEVHAVPLGITYDKRNEASYIKHPISHLEDLVYECDKYALLKVYVLDYRSAEQSLLGNGVIDIKLIDAPGLNMDSYQTTQVFSRQEEIDLVVFVVSAENHFTLSAKEFIAAAAAEKRYVFIVVNRFDNIKNKDKCMNKILDQVKSLSPDTYKNAKDFIHFVSSSSVPGGRDDGPDGGPDSNTPEFADPNFDNLEASLRKFILDKRSISKLLPAKNYLVNLLSDLKTLSEINQKIYLNEQETMREVLKQQIGPKYETMVRECLSGNDKINRIVERTCTDAYDNTRREILETVDNFGSSQIVPYLGLQYVYEYARDTQKKMIDTIVSSVQKSESSAKNLTGCAVQEIIDFGKQTLGDEFLTDKEFKPDLMFTRRRDTIKRSLNDSIEISDFFDPSFDSMMMWLGVPEAFVSSTRDQISHFSPVMLFGTIPRSMSSIKQTLPTQLTLHTLYSSTKVLTTGALIRKVYNFSAVLKPSVIKHAVLPVVLGIGGFAVFYLINDIPNAFPKKQARKLRKQVMEIDYAHINADRISKECRSVLNFPARQVMNNFQTSIDKRNGEKERLESEIRNAEISSGYFKALLEQISHQKSCVDEIDLESVYTVD